MRLFITALLTLGLYFVLTAHLPCVYKPAAAALRKRAPKPPNFTERLTSKMAHTILPLVSIDDPAKYTQIQEGLKNTGSNDSPEIYKAKAISRSAILAGAVGLVLFPFSIFFGIALMAVLVVVFYKSEMKRLNKQLKERRQRIERELPQLASTISQSLRSTRDVVSILTSYRKICGPALAGEIEHTINDMVTGNPERALKALEGRVNSSKLSQITRGLTSVLHGEEQSIYFQILASELRKAQDEEVRKELQKRPEQTYPYMGLLFVCLVLMLIASIGVYIFHQMGSLY